MSDPRTRDFERAVVAGDQEAVGPLVVARLRAGVIARQDLALAVEFTKPMLSTPPGRKIPWNWPPTYKFWPWGDEVWDDDLSRALVPYPLLPQSARAAYLFMIRPFNRMRDLHRLLAGIAGSASPKIPTMAQARRGLASVSPSLRLLRRAEWGGISPVSLFGIRIWEDEEGLINEEINLSPRSQELMHEFWEAEGGGGPYPEWEGPYLDDAARWVFLRRAREGDRVALGALARLRRTNVVQYLSVLYGRALDDWAVLRDLIGLLAEGPYSGWGAPNEPVGSHPDLEAIATIYEIEDQIVSLLFGGPPL